VALAGHVDRRRTELWLSAITAQSSAERLALSFLLGYSGNSRKAYTNDLRAWFAWCAQLGVDPLEARRADVDAYAGWLGETPQPKTGKAAAPSTIARRLSAIAGMYQYAVDEGLLDRSPRCMTGRTSAPTRSRPDSIGTGCARW
jgi:integrase/recombinase XerD